MKGTEYNFNVLPIEWIEPVLSKCESPIEKILYVFMSLNEPEDMGIHIQKELCIMGRIRRPDFIITLEPPMRGLPRPLFVVETDGSFHNNEANVMADKMRDRDLLSSGLPVIRFTGKEVFNEPESCAYEIHEMFRTYKQNLMASIFDASGHKLDNPFSEDYLAWVEEWKKREQS